MNIKSLTLKNKNIDERSREEFFDLSSPSFKYDPNLGIKAVHYVLPDQAGRIDIICDLYFGTSEYIDAICIVNGIFNPFSIEEGDILLIPNLDRPDDLYQKPNKIEKVDPVIDQYINTGRLSKKDQSRIERLKNKTKDRANGSETPLPPNVIQRNKPATIKKDGKIILGSNLNTK